MVKALALTILTILLITSIASAAVSHLEFKVGSSQKLVISILEPNSVYTLIDKYSIQADIMGNAQLNYSTTKNLFDIKVEVNTASNQFLFAERFEDVEAGKPYFMQVIQDNLDSHYIEEVAAPVTTSEDTNSTDVNSTITGNVISGDLTKFSVNWRYILYGLLVFVVAAGLVVFLMSKKSRVPREIRTMPASDLPGMSSRLQETERKLQEAQKELATIKNAERIKEIEARIAQEQSELDKLRQN